MPRLGVPMVGVVPMSLRIVSKVGEGRLGAGPGLPMVRSMGGPMNVFPIIVDEELRGDMVGGVLGIQRVGLLREGGRQ